VSRWRAARWIAEFEDLGGMIWLAATSAGAVELCLGWWAVRNPLERQIEARKMIEELAARPRRWRAVWGAVTACYAAKAATAA
jgi:hypothetical protein